MTDYDKLDQAQEDTELEDIKTVDAVVENADFEQAENDGDISNIKEENSILDDVLDKSKGLEILDTIADESQEINENTTNKINEDVLSLNALDLHDFETENNQESIEQEIKNNETVDNKNNNDDVLIISAKDILYSVNAVNNTEENLGKIKDEDKSNEDNNFIDISKTIQDNILNLNNFFDTSNVNKVVNEKTEENNIDTQDILKVDNDTNLENDLNTIDSSKKEQDIPAQYDKKEEETVTEIPEVEDNNWQPSTRISMNEPITNIGNNSYFDSLFSKQKNNDSKIDDYYSFFLNEDTDKPKPNYIDNFENSEAELFDKAKQIGIHVDEVTPVKDSQTQGISKRRGFTDYIEDTIEPVKENPKETSKSQLIAQIKEKLQKSFSGDSDNDNKYLDENTSPVIETYDIKPEQKADEPVVETDITNTDNIINQETPISLQDVGGHEINEVPEIEPEETEVTEPEFVETENYDNQETQTPLQEDNDTLVEETPKVVVPVIDEVQNDEEISNEVVTEENFVQDDAKPENIEETFDDVAEVTTDSGIENNKDVSSSFDTQEEAESENVEASIDDVEEVTNDNSIEINEDVSPVINSQEDLSVETKDEIIEESDAKEDQISIPEKQEEEIADDTAETEAQISDTATESITDSFVNNSFNSETIKYEPFDLIHYDDNENINVAIDNSETKAGPIKFIPFEQISREKAFDHTKNIKKIKNTKSNIKDNKNKQKVNKSTNKDNKNKQEIVRPVNKNNKNKRSKPKKSTYVLSIMMSLFLIIALLGVAGVSTFVFILCDGMPELQTSDLISPDSSTIYDSDGNKIMEVGMYLRENIDYEELPNCLIDAFLASEDSRYFEHIGFDIPRFTKALISYIKNGGEISSGGSTITMQLIKNSYFSIDADGDSTIAAREGMSGIKRKMQEIILSIELTLSKDVTKQETLAWFVNKVNYGNNIRGVEKAAQYYFGKSAKDLNVGESAFLAGIINAPNTYNPYNNLYKYDSIYLDPDSDYLVNATERRDQVLDLMVYHGYISEAEADLYKSIRIEDMLHGVSDNFTETNEKYQWYIDAVIDEVEEMTGESPYYVGMDIYTNMNAYMQELVYEIQNNEEVMEFPNELCQSAIVLMDNQTGAVEALGGGRGEVSEARTFNRATSAYLNPGSTIKPVVDYSLAIEYLGWSTSHTITDMPYYLYDGPALISNYDHTYRGDMLMTEALGRSQNTPAVQTLKAVCDKIGEDKVVDYLNSIGFDFEYEDFDLQFGIGGNRCLVTPEQLAGAHAIFMNGGKYIKPHTINYIDYVDDTREDYVADTQGTQVLSEATAWMTAYLEWYNMNGAYSSLMWYCKRDYPLYGKTGTTDWGTSGVDYGIPESATKDSWLVMQTNRYTISCWTGYDELQEGAYFTNAEYQENTKSKIVSLILDELETHASYEDYDPTIEMEKPDSVAEISFQKGTFPYVTSNPEIKGYIWDKWLDENTGSLQDALNYSNSVKKYVDAGITQINAYYNGSIVSVSFTVTNGTSGLLSGELVDLSSSNVYNETTYAVGPVWFPHFQTIYLGTAEPPYYFNVIVNGTIVASGSTAATNFTVSAPGGTSCTIEMWTTNPENKITLDVPIST